MLWFLTFTLSSISLVAQVPPLNVDLVANWDGHDPNYTAADLWADDQGFAYVCNRLGATIFNDEQAESKVFTFTSKLYCSSFFQKTRNLLIVLVSYGGLPML